MISTRISSCLQILFCIFIIPTVIHGQIKPGPVANAPAFGPLKIGKPANISHDNFPMPLGILGTDVRITNDSTPQNSTNIAVDPYDPDIVIGVFRDLTWNGSWEYRVGGAYSSDGGENWIHLMDKIPLHSDSMTYTFSPGITFDSHHRSYYGFGGSIPGPSFRTNNGVYICTSMDGGKWWTDPYPIAEQLYNGFQRVDWEDAGFPCADQHIGSPYRDRVYYTWTRFYGGYYPGTLVEGGGDIMFSFSTDHGISWSIPTRLTDPIHEPANHGSGDSVGRSYVVRPEISVATNGDLYISYHNAGRTNVSRSTDGGSTFTTPTYPFGTTFEVSNVHSTSPFNFREYPSPNIETDPVRPGHVYVVSTDDQWQMISNPQSMGRDVSDIIFSRSTDFGATWNSQRVLNTDPVGNLQIYPWMAVDNLGNISVIWYDNRLNSYQLDVYETHSTDGGLTWSPDARLTDIGFNPNNSGWPTNMGINIGYDAGSDGTFHALWTDTRTGGQEIFYDNLVVEIPAPLFSASPDPLTIGNAQAGAMTTDSITVTNIGSITLNISSVVSDDDQFSITPDSAVIAPSDSTKFYITVQPGCYGPVSGNIIFWNDGKNSPDSVAVSSFGTGIGFAAEVVVCPQELAYGNVVVGSVGTDSFYVVNPHPWIEFIDSITVENALFTTLLTSDSILPNEVKSIPVQFSPDSMGLEVGSIVLFATGMSKPDTILINGAGVAPLFIADPDSIDFGEVPIGTWKMENISISNVGTSDLHLSDITCTDSHFSVILDSGSVPPISEMDVGVIFTPEDLSPQSGYVVIEHDATGSPDTVWVFGRGGNSMKLDSGWNMISLPTQISQTEKNILFPESVSPAYRFKGGYQTEDSMESGLGYWLKFINQSQPLFVGDPIDDDTVMLEVGWNLIGTTSFPVVVSSISSIPSAIITTDFYKYIPSIGDYVTSDTLKPGNAYWVKVSEAGQLLFSSSPELLPKNSFIHVVATDDLPPSPPNENNESALNLPLDFALLQNYPNPFNPETQIKYALPVSGHVKLRIYNILGQVIEVLVDEEQDPGYKSISFDGRNIPSGVYFYKITAGSFSDVKKMLLLK